MDVFMPKLNGHEAVKMIKDQYPDIRILILSMCMDMDLLSDLLDAGVYGILSKSDEPEDLVQAIVSLSDRKIYRSKLFTEVMYWNKQQTNKQKADIQDVSLSKREKQIIQMLWEEKSNKEIANYMFLSTRSVEKIRQNLKEKLGVKSTVGLLKYAINKRIILVNAWSPETIQTVLK
jgi:DNA-binding NarL/FixJ family response regulator